MRELEELEYLVGSIDNIEPYGMEPDFSSLGIEPADVLGFNNDEELEHAIKLLTQDTKQQQILFFNV